MELTLGKKQVLTIVKQVEFGVYLGTEKEKVLLPKNRCRKEQNREIRWKSFSIKILRIA